MTRDVDTLVRRATIITMDDERRILREGSFAIDAGRIVGIGPDSSIEPHFRARRVIDGQSFLITPGFINGHVHITGDPLTRGYMPDTMDYRSERTFLDWVLPRFYEQTPTDEAISAQLAACEMLRCGITCFLEAGTIRFVEEVASALRETGIRARIGLWTEGRAFDPAEDPVQVSDAAIAAMTRAVEAYLPGRYGRIAAWPILVGHNTNSDAVWLAARALADDHGLAIAAHMSPHGSDTQWYLEHVRRRPIEHLHHLGLLGEKLVLTHVTHLSDNEHALLAESGTNIVYCPLATSKGAFGAARHGRYPELARDGANLVLGTDGYDADILRTLPIASATFKDARGDTSVFPAHQMLETITVNAARALGMSDEIGSLAVGMRADFVCHDVRRPEMTPLLNPVNQLVWSADGRGVHSVWIEGEPLIEGYRFTRLDEEALLRSAQVAGENLIRRTGLPLVSPWPIVER